MIQKHITQICKICKKELPLTDFAQNEDGEVQEVCWDCADVCFEIAQEHAREMELEQAAEQIYGGY